MSGADIKPLHLTWWRNDHGRLVASGQEGATSVTVEIENRYYPTWEFELPHEQRDFEKLTAALEMAFRLGRKAKAADMRAALAE